MRVNLFLVSYLWISASEASNDEGSWGEEVEGSLADPYMEDLILHITHEGSSKEVYPTYEKHPITDFSCEGKVDGGRLTL